MTSDGAIYPELLEYFVRDELNRTATRWRFIKPFP